MMGVFFPKIPYVILEHGIYLVYIYTSTVYATLLAASDNQWKINQKNLLSTMMHI